MAQALLFDGPSSGLRLIEQPRPEPRLSEVLVRVEAATLCASDLHTLAGKRQVETPTVLGHETIGRVEEIGPGYPPRCLGGEILHVGDRITWAVVVHCGACVPCLRELPQKCIRSIKYGHEPWIDRRMWTGGLATWNLLAPGTSIARLPTGLPAGMATPASCATATICAALEALGPISNRHLLITGAGMLGLTATALARRMGTGSITMVDPIPWRCEKALLMGANRAIGAFPSKTGNLEPVDAWLELSGTNTAWESGFDMLGVGASVVLVGSVFPTPDTCFNLERVVRRMISIRGVHNYAPRHLSMALGLLEKLGPTHPLGGLTGPWFTLANHAEALRAAADPQVLRVGFRPE